MNLRTANWEHYENEKHLKVNGVHWSLASDCFVVVVDQKTILRTQDAQEARLRWAKHLEEIAR
jgi:hypothetical protein